MEWARRAAVYLAIVAMALRALMPAGWMPNPDGAAKTAFVICDMGEMDMSGMAGMDMSKMSGADHATAADHGPAKKSNDSHQHEDCPFAAAPHFATSSAVAMLLPPSSAAGFLQHLAGAQVAVQSAAYAPQSPRAPPTIV
jgi:hypothetical protein